MIYLSLVSSCWNFLNYDPHLYNWLISNPRRCVCTPLSGRERNNFSEQPHSFQTQESTISLILIIIRKIRRKKLQKAKSTKNITRHYLERMSQLYYRMVLLASLMGVFRSLSGGHSHSLFKTCWQYLPRQKWY